MDQETYMKIMGYVPTVIEASSRGERSFDIFSSKSLRLILLSERVMTLPSKTLFSFVLLSFLLFYAHSSICEKCVSSWVLELTHFNLQSLNYS